VQQPPRSGSSSEVCPDERVAKRRRRDDFNDMLLGQAERALEHERAERERDKRALEHERAERERDKLTAALAREREIIYTTQRVLKKMLEDDQ
jgi:hypothetical protein